MAPIPDVLIVGAGPAGSTAALALARAGVRVRLVDRATFPRDKLCGDTINPGTIAILRRIGVARDVERLGLPIVGFRVSGPGGVVVGGRYPAPGRAMKRRDLDVVLLDAATAAGAVFDDGVRVTGATIDGGRVHGVRVRRAGADARVDAPVVIAADGRRSPLAFGLGLAAHPMAPRRWAIGAYYGDVEALDDFGEMHVRRDHYVGIAALPAGFVNVCAVTMKEPAAGALADPKAFLARTLAEDPMLRDRFARSRPLTAPVVLGPLAIDARATGVDGLLLAGDAAGFVDPITGDGLRFAIRGGELAAAAALDALAHGWRGVHARYRAARGAEFGAKWRFDRAVRRLVSARGGVAAAAYGARIAPRLLAAAIRKAGDCPRS